MSNVSVQISGRSYTIACAEGEESHIKMLARSIDSKLAAIPNLANQSEPRSLLFAALLLADELHEAQKTAPSAAASTGASAEPLEKMAERLESLASQLETTARST